MIQQKIISEINWLREVLEKIEKDMDDLHPTDKAGYAELQEEWDDINNDLQKLRNSI